MGGGNTVCLKMLKSYLEEEHNDKKKQPYDTSDWTLVNRHQVSLFKVKSFFFI